MQHPTIVLISGKHPIEAKSGYARYTAALARQLVSLHYSVHIFCVGTTTSVIKTSIGTIHVVRMPMIRLVAGREMTALLPASILIARAIKQQTHVDIIWGIGPWTLAGVLTGKKPIFADYFTTLKHEYRISLFSFLERYILTKSTRIITHYRSTEHILQKEFGLTRKKFYRIPYAIS